MNYSSILVVWISMLAFSPLFSQEADESTSSDPKIEKEQAWKLEFTYSLNVRNTTPHPALQENWEAFTPQDAITYKEDRFSNPYSLELNYYPAKHFAIGPFVAREIYKMIDKKKNEWDQAQAPSGTYIPSTSYDVILFS